MFYFPHICTNIYVCMTCFVIVAAAPLRAKPSHKSEMISQLLFGELADWMDEKGDFVRIRCRFDGYEGWCQRKQLTILGSDEIPLSGTLTRHLEDRVVVNGISFSLSPGSTCPVEQNHEEMIMGSYKLHFSAGNEVPSFLNKAEEIEYYACLFLGTPYVWGGRSLFGIDCSGLTQTVYRLAGITLPRDSGPQSNGGEVVNLLQEAKKGDLAFFDNEEGKIVHVGILLSTDTILHASASVRIDPIDNYGIIHRQEGDRTHKLRIIKRFF